MQGLSGIKNLKRRHLLDPGATTASAPRSTPPDAMLMLHILKPDWKAGKIESVPTIFLHDPDRKVPFRIVNENTPKRYLTGSDFDIETIQPIGDAGGSARSWALTWSTPTGPARSWRVFETKIDGKLVRSPDQPYSRRRLARRGR